MKVQSHRFKALAEKALQNKQLQLNLMLLGLGIEARRGQVFSDFDDPEAVRDRGRAIRERAIENLPQLLETLEENVLNAGGIVHWARTAREARRIVLELAEKHGVRSVVKGKSMVSEEIGLNEALADRGIDVYESDLGEFIIQLAGEPPSHIVGPALHKSKEEVAELFAEKLGVPLVEDPEALTMIAREHLREKFLQADMGITGANMAVAETGTIVLLENEGNIRMSTTLPRIHVALMGIEKVVGTLEEMSVILSLLPRSATGQRLSSYGSLITGCRRQGELDGAEAFHLILLDNGRTRILADPDRRETLYCIRCGACLNICPVYRKAGGHSYGWVYSGPIGAVLTPQLITPRVARALPFASTLCGACATVCPVKIDLPKLLLTLRWRLTEDPNWDGGIPLPQRLLMFAFGWVAANPWLYDLVSRGARLLTPLLSPSGEWLWLPPPLSRWARKRRLPQPAEPFSHIWDRERKTMQKGGEGS